MRPGGEGERTRLAHTINTARQLTQHMRGRVLDSNSADALAVKLREAARLLRDAPPPKVKSQPSRRRILHRRDPRCIFCGRVTIFEAFGVPHAATLDHLYSRAHPRRQSTRKHLPPTVLACYECNHERGAKPATTAQVCPVLKLGR